MITSNGFKKESQMDKANYSGAEKTAEVCMIWPTAAADQMGKIVEQCNFTDRIIATSKHIVGKGGLASSAGFAAEEVTAKTFNLDAILKNKSVRAFTDACENSPIPTHDPVRDVVVVDKGQQVKTAQLKFYKTAERTEKAFRDIRGGEGHYNEVDQMVAPVDQIDGVRDAARIDELKNQGRRPDVSDAARQIQKKATDRVSHDGVESRPLTKAEAEQIAKEAKKGEGKGLHKKIQNSYKNRSTLQQTAKAATGAAVVTTVIAGTINTVSCLRKVQAGQMTPADAMKYILTNTAIAASDSALKAAGATAAVSITARSLPELFTGSALNANLATGAVGGAAVCAVDLVECLVKVAAGKMTWKQLEERTGKNVFQTGAGVVGASIGGALGSAAGPIGTMAGALIGGMITSVATTVAIENQIEKPFREIMGNAESLLATENVMVQAISYLGSAGASMEEFKKCLFSSELDFKHGMNDLRKKRESNWNRINNLK